MTSHLGREEASKEAVDRIEEAGKEAEVGARSVRTAQHLHTIPWNPCLQEIRDWQG